MKLQQIVGRAVNKIGVPLLRSAAADLKLRRRAASTKRRLAGHTKLHLGCGPHVLDGWANLDLSHDPGVIRWDLTQPLPVESGTVDYVYSEHFIEHVTREQARALLSECHRVLRPGGVVRLSTPNLRKLVDEYLRGRLSEWSDVGWSPATPCRLLNEGLRLWEHQFVYDAEELERTLEAVGLGRITRAAWRQSDHAALAGLECRPFHDEIILEAVK